MRIVLLFICVCIIAFAVGCNYGIRQTKREIVIKKAGVINNVAKKRAEIQAKPNRRRNELLEFMRNGQL